MVYITRIEHFNAAHKLFNPEWTNDRNMEVFGKCSNPNWHGHNYELHVTVKGTTHTDTGFVFNAKTLGDMIKTHITDVVDHKNLNLDVPFMTGKHTSVENLCVEIFLILAPLVQSEGAQLHCVKLYETPRIFAEYYGE